MSKGVEVKLGDRVRDKITGFEGVAVARTQYLNGCARIAVQSTVLKEGKPLDTEWFDEKQVGPSQGKTGGPGITPPQRTTPPQRATPPM